MNFSRDSFHRYRNLGLNLVICGGFTLLATGMTFAFELGQAKNRYHNLSNHLKEHFQQSLEENYRISQSLAGFYNASERVTARSFTQFTLFFLQEYPALSGIAWIERVPLAQKAQFERSLPSRGLPPAPIFRLDDRQIRTAIDDRPEYFPLTYAEPFDKFQSLLGFDLGSQQTYRLSLNQAINLENAVVGTPIASKARDIFGFALYHPIYRREKITKNAEERRQALLGFVYTDYQWQTLVRHSLENSGKDRLDFYLVNDPGTERQLLMFYDRLQDRVIDHPDRLKQIQNNSDRLRLPVFCQILLNCQYPLEIANQHWILVLIPDRSLLGIPWKTIVIAILGSGLTAWITGLGLRSQREKQNLQRVYDQNNIELRQVKEVLAQQVDQQAAELKAAHRASNELLSNISHELRTPLNIISGFIQLINRDPKLSESQRSTLAIISRSGDYLLTLFNDILEMSQIEVGNSTINFTVFNLLTLVSSVVEMLQLRASAKGLRINLYFAEEIPAYVKTDESKLRQILMNLLDNAIKFTVNGSITLRVESSDDGWNFDENIQDDCDDNLQVFLFEVEDTGRGIPTSEWEQIFEPFIQGEAIRRQPSQGTGLGLYITRRLIRLMGGDIRVIESVVDRGSLFRFSLPLQLPNPKELAIQQSSQRIVGLAPHQSDFRVLVVDDRPENRQLFSQLLVPLGFQLREASNGEEAIAIWSDWRPHAIFMDTRMPVMDGFRAIEYIRDRTQLKQTIVIALTSSGMDSKQVDQLAIACDDILYKPFSIDTVLDKLSKHLGVIYRYEELEDAGWAKDRSQITVSSTLQPQDLQMMPPEWRQEVFQAASAGDSLHLFSLIEQIPADKSQMIAELTDLVKLFQFSVLRELIQDETTT